MPRTITKIRGVRGAAALCALAALAYLFVQNLLTVFVSALMNLRVQGASLSDPVGFSITTQGILSILVAAGAILLPLWWLLRSTRLQAQDLRLLLPAPWSPAFCLVVFLGLANAGNLFGGLLARGLGVTTSSVALPAGGVDLFIRFLSLCLVPAVLEELYFRGALQGLMRPSGSSVAIFAPALLFALLHLDLAQSITALLCGVFLGWLVERSGSILPGMLLHFANNVLAFFSLYLRQYAPAQVALVYELVLLIVLPLIALCLVWRVKAQGFSFSAGLRGGAEPLAVFASLPYTACVLFLMGLTIYLYRAG